MHHHHPTIITVRYGPGGVSSILHLSYGLISRRGTLMYIMAQESKSTTRPVTRYPTPRSIRSPPCDSPLTPRFYQISSNPVQNCSEICFAPISERPIPAASHPKRHCQTMTTPDSSQFPIVCPVSLKAKSSEDLRLTIMMDGWRALLESRLEEKKATHST